MINTNRLFMMMFMFMLDSLVKAEQAGEDEDVTISWRQCSML